jgi:outer membrane protein assembly factor BamB
MPLRHRIGIVVVALIVTPAATVLAQRNVGPDPTRTTGVYVRDSAVAAEKLALAERMERLKEWDKSADVYQEIVEKYADRVVPIGPGGALQQPAAPPAEPPPPPPAEGAAPQPPPPDAEVPAARDRAAAPVDKNAPLPRYKSVTLAVQERLGKWPEEGLNTYRARYETQAAALREQAGPDDAAALSRVTQLYFPTDASKLAAMRLIELYIETGEFAAAAWTGERMLAFHPSLAEDRAKLLFRTALAEHLGGDAGAARAKLDELKAKHADAKGKFAGQDVVLAAILEKALSSPAATANGSANDSWPIFGGDATRGRVPVAAGRPGTKLLDIPFVRPRAMPPGRAGDAVPVNIPMRGPQPVDANGNAAAAARKPGDNSASLGVMPVADRGEIFYHDNTRVFAKGMESGFTLPGWTTTYGDDAAGMRQRFTPGTLPYPPNVQLTVTVTDSSVLAVLGQGLRPQLNEMGIMAPPESITQLVCLDRQTGARRWTLSPRTLPDSLANLRQLELGGSPLVVGDNVYVAARGGKPQQFEDSYVLCVNLTDGRVRWACYLASGNGTNFQQPQLPNGGVDVSHLAYAGGRVYAVTNLGAVASIDAYAGPIAWLSLYPRPLGNPMFALYGGVPGAARRPWAHNPAVVRDGHVFCLPSDSQHLLVYDAASGDEVKRIAMSDFDNADTLVGVAPDHRLVLTSQNKVYCVDWTKYAPGGKTEDCVLWYTTPSGEGATTDEAKDVVRGRAFLTSDSVFVPTRWKLERYGLKSGRRDTPYPTKGAWPAGEGPGNVVVTGDQILIAGGEGIAVYSDLNLARAKLDQRIEANPSDPLPRLMYAERLFAAGQTEAAVEKLDAAIQLLGGLRSMRPGVERDRAFARALAFAQRLAWPREGASDPAKALGLFDRAGAAANSPPQQVSYRLSLAKFAREQRDFNAEVRLYQEILSNPSWRAVVVPGEDGGATKTAAALAEASIADRVKDAPPSYGPFEQQAAEKFAIARQAKDPAQMLAVAQVYPNSKVAPDAMIAAAGAYEDAGKFLPATQVLNAAYRKYYDRADRALIIEAIARNNLRLPGRIGIAIGRLDEGNKLLNSPQLKGALKLPDGQTIENVSFAAAAELLQKYSAQAASAALPDFNIPAWPKDANRKNRKKPFVPETAESIIADVDALLVPPRPLRESASRNDRVVTWTRNRGVSVYAVGSNVPIGTNASMTRQPVGIAWCNGGKDLLVWTADRLTLLKGDALASGWDVTVKTLPQVEIVDAADAVSRVDDIQPPRGVPVAPDMIFVDNQIMNLPGGPGMGRLRNAAQMARAAALAAGQQQQQAERIDHVRPLGDRVVVATSTGRITALDLAGGQPAWQTRTGDAAIDQLVANDDFIAARFDDDGGVQLVALDTFAGQVVMRTTFTPDTAPANIALAPDGTLLYTRPDRVCGKDLYEPGNSLKFGGDSATAPEGAGQVFNRTGAPGGDDLDTAAEQIVVAQGRIYAVADHGQFVRVLSLYDGREIGHKLQTEAKDWNVRLRVVGPRLYVFTSETAFSYHVVREDESWMGTIDRFQRPTVRDFFIGKSHVVLLDQSAAAMQQMAGGAGGGGGAGEAGPDTSPRFRLLAYARYPTAAGRDDESGKFDQSVDITHAVGIHLKQWQGVEGGFYYHSVDRKLHFLKGSGPVEAQ